MRWKNKIKENLKPLSEGRILLGKKGPECGDIKENIKFAFLPKRINKKYVVWLEKYIEVYEYRKTFYKSYTDSQYIGTRFECFSYELKEGLDWCFKENKLFNYE